MKQSWIAPMILAAGITAISGLAVAAEPLLEPGRLQALAREANTPGEHATVAKQYRMRAETFDAKAAEHEKNVERLGKSMGAMYHKWPGMAPRSLQTEKGEALDARRAARESRELADTHLRLSVEALASAAR